MQFMLRCNIIIYTLSHHVARVINVATIYCAKYNIVNNDMV